MGILKPIQYDAVKNDLFKKMPRIHAINYLRFSPEGLARSLQALDYQEAVRLWHSIQFCRPPQTPEEMRDFIIFVEPAILSLQHSLLMHIRILDPTEIWAEEFHNQLLQFQDFVLHRWGANLYGMFRGELLFVQERRSKRLYVRVTKVPSLGGIFDRLKEDWQGPPPPGGCGGGVGGKGRGRGGGRGGRGGGAGGIKA